MARARIMARVNVRFSNMARANASARFRTRTGLWTRVLVRFRSMGMSSARASVRVMARVWLGLRPSLGLRLFVAGLGVGFG
jgi:hypothetical protein